MTTQTHQQVYEARVLKFAEGKTFQYLTSIKVKRGDIRCDACGSKLVQGLRLIQDNNGEYYLIGVNCHTELYNIQKMCLNVYPHTPQDSQKIAEQLVIAKMTEVPPVARIAPIIFNPDNLTIEIVNPKRLVRSNE